MVRFVLYRVREFERAVVLGSTLDRAEVRGPGLVLVLPGLQQLEIIDIRTKVFEVPTSFQGYGGSYCMKVPSQQLLTTDSVTLTVDAVVYYRVFDPVRAATALLDYNVAVRGLASSTLGGILGTYQLGNLLSER